MFNQNIPVYDIPTSKIPVVSVPEQPKRRPKNKQYWLALASVVGLSTFLNFYHLQLNRYGNNYYAATVKSMLVNWHNFFFLSFDPGGFVTADKPPIDLWLQALSAKLFGFSGVSLLLPQALAGVLAVVVLFHLVQRSFGTLAGLLAGLIMAITPIGVAISRNNNIDMMLVLVILLATWAVVLATETGKLWWLLLGAVLIGVGFNVKMLEAYLVLPALGLLYLCSAPRKWWLRCIHLALALLVLLSVSFSWIITVDLTPPDQRPYVGSSQTNSELELALGYNGVGRLIHVSAGKKPSPTPSAYLSSYTALFILQAWGAEMQTASTATSESASPEIGQPGLLRLLTQPLGGQIGWFLPLALVGAWALFWRQRQRLRQPVSTEARALILWGTWLLTQLVVFSIAVSFHAYYTVMIEPAISALTGISLVMLWRDYRSGSRKGWWAWILPLTFLLTAVFQATLLTAYPNWSVPLSVLTIVMAVLAGLGLAGSGLLANLPQHWSRIVQVIFVLGIGAVLLAPSLLSCASLAYAENGGSPTAHLPVGNFQDFFQAIISSPASDTTESYPLNVNQRKLLDYLRTQHGNTRFLLATLDAGTAAPLILATGQPMMALGGFSGNDPILTTSNLEDDITDGTVHFFLLPFIMRVGQHGQQIFLPTGGQNVALVRWVAANCTAVPSQAWEPGRFVQTKDGKTTFRPSGNSQRINNQTIIGRLYNCEPGAWPLGASS